MRDCVTVTPCSLGPVGRTRPLCPTAVKPPGAVRQQSGRHVRSWPIFRPRERPLCPCRRARPESRPSTGKNDPKRPVVDTRRGVCRQTALRRAVFTPSARRRPLFEARQPVSEFDPAELVTSPAVSDRWECVWIIEAAGGDVDGSPVFGAPIRQRGAAAPTESPREGRRRVVFNRFPGSECEIICIHVRPRHDRRGGSLATTAALTSAGNQRFALNSIPHRATQTPSLNDLAHGAPLESSWSCELYFATDLAPGMQRSWLLLSANCHCGNRLPHGPHLNPPLRAAFLRLLKTASGR